MNSGRLMALGALSGLPVNALIIYVQYIYSHLESGPNAPSLVSILISQLLWSAAGLFVAWRWSYLAWIRTVLGILSILSIPATIVAAWLGYVRLIGHYL